MTKPSYDRITLRPWERGFTLRVRRGYPSGRFALVRLYWWEWRLWW